ncbi:hypothetical protein OTERR_29590 [Oryzomicrobium terrae]|uniref:DUF485 domain-containing protein n=1 Tax=Oryzomicrobium terrae TaxID=1735038 RepID=A0A5C1ECQ1_9RHOO|nr:DUF485 domain-containing protein [Oryzomicrobium terrae]QEL66435.1 hypothetical protein OTERR_29590 [Oryzomicrobium terrae]
MTTQVYERIRNNPQFHQLVASRSRFAWLLSAVVFVLFYGFIMLVAFTPELLGARLSADSVVTVGMAGGFAIFVLFWVLTAIYVKRANGEFDEMTSDIVRKAQEQ